MNNQPTLYIQSDYLEKKSDGGQQSKLFNILGLQYLLQDLAVTQTVLHSSAWSDAIMPDWMVSAGLQSPRVSHMWCEGNVLTSPPHTGTGSHCFHFYMLELCWSSAGGGYLVFVTSLSSSAPPDTNNVFLTLIYVIYVDIWSSSFYQVTTGSTVARAWLSDWTPSDKSGSEYTERECFWRSS